jgi:2-polyprenyl-3-methyl-5-hydroxy-6-metoxy-1,4-benzoquinol methylase
MNEPIIENGVLAGNYYDKYNSANPVAGYLMKRFIGSVNKLVAMSGAENIHEVGCGEGSLAAVLAGSGKKVRASDFSQKVIEMARERSTKAGVEVEFKAASLYDLRPAEDGAELVVCCEVLEHLEDPHRAMGALAGLSQPHLLISVPREPLWRMMNMARGKYLGALGNTPGHIQHWSRKSFLRLLQAHVDVIKVLSPLPWTMALCRTRRR